MEKQKLMMMEKEEAKRHGRRLVLVVCPFQAHINPMLQLATILYSKGFSITVLHPEFNSPNHSNHPDFTFVSIPDGLSNVSASPGDFGAIISAINRSCEAPFQRYMEQILEGEDRHDRVAGVIYDGFMHFAQRVANHLKIPRITVRTSAAASLFAFAVSRHPDGHGYLPFQGTFYFYFFISPLSRYLLIWIKLFKVVFIFIFVGIRKHKILTQNTKYHVIKKIIYIYI
jgi:hypothetical protein